MTSIDKKIEERNEAYKELKAKIKNIKAGYFGRELLTTEDFELIVYSLEAVIES